MTELDDQREQGDPTVTRHTIGMLEIGLAERPNPWVFIEATGAMPSGGLEMEIRAGGGAEEDSSALPLLYVTGLPFEQNHIGQELAKLIDEIRNHPTFDAVEIAQRVETVVRVAAVLGVPYEPAGDGA